MRKLLIRLARTMRWLTGTGAVENARLEVDRFSASLKELDAQLGRVSGSSPRRAA